MDHREPHLVLHGGYAKRRLLRKDEAERADGEAILTLMQHGWGRSGSAFINAFSAMFAPGATREQTESLVELQRLTTSADNAVALRQAVDRFDVTSLLSQVSVRTLVIHAREDAIHPLEQGYRLASSIPDAEFRMLESRNHIPLPNEPSWDAFFRAVEGFVGSAAHPGA